MKLSYQDVEPLLVASERLISEVPGEVVERLWCEFDFAPEGAWIFDNW